MIKETLLVGAGGFIGSVSRFYLSRLNLTVSSGSIPVGTLIVNTAGCLVIGYLLGTAENSMHLSLEWRLFLMTGFCGGFTTFSTFSSENLTLIHNGQFMTFILYTITTIILTFLAVFLGYGLSRIVMGG